MPLYINALPLELGGFGIGSYTRDLILGLARSEFADEVILLCPPWLERHPTLLASGLQAISIPAPHWLPPLIRAQVWCEKVGWWLSRKREATFFSPAPFAATFCCRDTWVTCHDCLPMRFPVYLGKNPWRKFSYRRGAAFLRRCQGVITDSLFSKDDITSFFRIPKGKTHVVPCWPAEHFSPGGASATKENVREKYRLPARYWLYLGGYDIRKNVEFLISTYASVLRSNPSKTPPLVLAGKFPNRIHPALCNPELAMNRAGLTRDEICTPGFIADEDLPGLYGGAELFVYPSLGEGFGLPPLEALSSGCPAIVADNTSLREVIVDPEYRFSATAPAELESLLTRAATSALALNPTLPAFRLETSLERLSTLLLPKG